MCQFDLPVAVSLSSEITTTEIPHCFMRTCAKTRQDLIKLAERVDLSRPPTSAFRLTPSGTPPGPLASVSVGLAV